MINGSFVFDKFLEFKNNLFKSRKYWIIYLFLVFSYFFFKIVSENYFNINELNFIFLFSFLGIFCISYFYGHNGDEGLYKSVFLIILIFGIVFSFLTPFLSVDDEIEHFVRAEMTSRGKFIPEYNEIPFVYGGIQYPGFYVTIQSLFDLSNDFKVTENHGYEFTSAPNVFVSDVVNVPINNTFVRYHSAFAQNPFFGYIAPALGILIAKLLNLNAVWLVWLGRLTNVMLYASLVSLAIKKTPILKMPLLIVACIPLALVQASSLSIDSLINGLAILSIAYFFDMYSSNNLNYNHIIKFSIIVLLLGLCKLTYFSFILLLIFVPGGNFKEKKYYFLGFLSISILVIISLLWSKYYANPVLNNSYRFIYFNMYHVNSMEQLNYVLSHKVDTLIILFNQVVYYFFTLEISYCELLNSLGFYFLLAVFLFYPQPKFNLKSKLGLLLIFLILFGGTIIVMLLTWTPVTCLLAYGFHSRYVLPALGLLPFIFGINYRKINTFKLDLYLICFIISFISFTLIKITMFVY